MPNLDRFSHALAHEYAQLTNTEREEIRNRVKLDVIWNFVNRFFDQYGYFPETELVRECHSFYDLDDQDIDNVIFECKTHSHIS